MYICVVKRLGILVGVIQRVKGIRASVSWSVLGVWKGTRIILSLFLRTLRQHYQYPLNLTEEAGRVAILSHCPMEEGQYYDVPISAVYVPVSITPPCSLTQSTNFIFPLYMSFLPLSLTLSSTSSRRSPLLFFASSIPLSSKHSRIAPIRYAPPSSCLFLSPGPGISPS